MQSGYYVNNQFNRNNAGANNFLYGRNKRYFSSLEAKVWFGSILIDEIVDFTYAVQQNSMPLFGYNSYTYDEMAVGSRIVNGAFVINFTEEHYVLKAMNELKNLSREQAVILKEQGAISIDEDSQFTTDNLSLWGEQFKITVEYGESVDTGSEVTSPPGITLTGVQITSVTTQNDIEGRPIMETYNFVGQDIVYHGHDQQESNHTPITPPSHSEKDLNPDSIADVTIRSAIIDETRAKRKGNAKIVINTDNIGNVKDLSIRVNTDNEYFQMKRVSEDTWESANEIIKPKEDMVANVAIHFLDGNTNRVHSKNENINIRNFDIS